MVDDKRFKLHFGKLYKYYSLDSNFRVRQIFRQIKNHQLYFSNPNHFNDPFDCKISSNYTGTHRECKEWSNELVINDQPNISKKKRKFNAKKIREQIKKGEFNLEDHPEILNQLGVACFSRSNKNILMWSHYADNHKGICLIFKSSIETNEIQLENKTNYSFHFADAFRVEYSKDYPNLSEINSTKEDKFIGRLFTKAEDWKYEKEMRIVLSELIKEDQRLCSYPKEALTGIIFGCEMEDKYKERIAKWVKDKDLDITLSQAKKSTKAFALDIDSYTP